MEVWIKMQNSDTITDMKYYIGAYNCNLRVSGWLMLN